MVTTAALLRRRTRSQVGLLALLGVLVAVVAGIGAGALGFVALSATSGARTTLDDAPATATGVQVQTRLSTDDPAGQDAAAQGVITRLVDGGPALVSRSIRTGPIDLLGIGDEAPSSTQRVLLGADVALADLAELTDGGWPQPVTGDDAGSESAPLEGALQARAAETLGVAVGDVLTIGSENPVRVVVTGLWEPLDADDDAWFGDRAVATGSSPADRGALGPLMTPEESLAAIGTQPFVRWTVRTDTPRVDPSELAPLASAFERIPGALDEEPGVVVRGATASGTGADELTDIAAALGAVRGTVAVPLIVLAVVSGLAIWQIVGLLVTVRSPETDLLTARGATRGQILRATTVEALAVVVPGGALGAAAAWAVLAAGAPGGAGAATSLVVGVPAAVAVVVLAIMLGTAAGDAASSHARRTAEASGRARTATTGAVIALVAAAAALSVWQLWRYGNPVVTRPDGTVAVDPVSAAAPALVLLTGGLLALGILGPATGVTARLAARRRGLWPVQPARQVARRVAVYAVPVMLLVLASGATTLAAAFTGTWTSVRTSAAALGSGTDVRSPAYDVAFITASTAPLGMPEYAELPGASDAAPVWHLTAGSEDVTAAGLAMNADRMPGTVVAPPELFDAPAVADALRSDDALTGTEVPAGAETLQLTATLQARGQVSDEVVFSGNSARDGTVRVWFASDDGELLVREAGTIVVRADPQVVCAAAPDGSLTDCAYDPATPNVGAPVTDTFDVRVPVDGTAWRVVAVDFDVRLSYFPTDVTFTVDALSADGQDLDVPSGWEVHPTTEAGEALGPTDTPGLTGTVQAPPEEFFSWSGPPFETVRAMPAQPDAVPLVVSAQAADALGWSEGDDVDLTVDGTDVAGRVVGVVPVVPGSRAADAVLTTPEAVGGALLAAGIAPSLPAEVWMTSDDPGATASGAAALRGSDDLVEVRPDPGDDPLTGPALDMFWLTAGAAAVLAVAGTAAVVVALARSRRGEVVVLRAIGESAGGQGRSRGTEVLGVTFAAIVAGAVVGAALSWLVVPPLASAAASSLPVDVDLLVDVASAVAAGGALVLCVAAIAVAHGAHVRAQARDTEWREEIR